MADLKVALQDLKDESESGTLQVRAGDAVSRQRYPRVLVGAAVIAVVLAAGAAWLAVRWRLSSREIALGPPVAVTSYDRIEEMPSLSPDGRQVAFSGNVDDPSNFDIYVKLIDSEPSLRLTHAPERDETPAWSPDGRWIAFIRGGSKLLLISPLGGAEKVVSELVGPWPVWTADSQTILTVAAVPGAEKRTLAIDICTGEKRALDWSGDGISRNISRQGQIAYWTGSPPGTNLYAATLAADLRSKEAKAMNARDLAIDGCTWTSEAEELICSARERGVGESLLWRILPDGSAPRPIPCTEGSFSPAAARDTLAFDRSTVAVQIHRIGLAPGTQSAAARFVAATGFNNCPSYSPDGRRIRVPVQSHW